MTPFTLSSVMVVRLGSPVSGLESHMILKLYDRRFATELRDDKGIPPWTLEIEKEYQKFILDGGASEFLARLRSHEDLVEEEGESWNAAQTEAYLYNYMQNLYDAETEVYQRLKDIQGVDVPKLLARLTLHDSLCSSDLSEGIDKYVDYHGILLELIHGFPLNELATHAPSQTWQSICEDAIRIVNVIGQRGIRNEDVKTRNFIVRHDPVKEKFKVFMIDFALCVLRGQQQDEQSWRRWKALQDEEGAVGFVMQRYLKGGFVYHRSPLYVKLDDEFMAEEDS